MTDMNSPAVIVVAWSEIRRPHLTGAADVAERGAAGLARRGVPRDDSCSGDVRTCSSVLLTTKSKTMNPSFSPTVLANVNADGVDVGDVGHGGPHGCTGGPHVVEEENRHGGEAENTKPGHAQNVGEEHKLVRGRKKQKKKICIGDP